MLFRDICISGKMKEKNRMITSRIKVIKSPLTDGETVGSRGFQVTGNALLFNQGSDYSICLIIL